MIFKRLLTYLGEDLWVVVDMPDLCIRALHWRTAVFTHD